MVLIPETKIYTKITFIQTNQQYFHTQKIDLNPDHQNSLFLSNLKVIALFLIPFNTPKDALMHTFFDAPSCVYSRNRNIARSLLSVSPLLRLV